MIKIFHKTYNKDLEVEINGDLLNIIEACRLDSLQYGGKQDYLWEKITSPYGMTKSGYHMELVFENGLLLQTSKISVSLAELDVQKISGSKSTVHLFDKMWVRTEWGRINYDHAPYMGWTTTLQFAWGKKRGMMYQFLDSTWRFHRVKNPPKYLNQAANLISIERSRIQDWLNEHGEREEVKA